MQPNEVPPVTAASVQAAIEASNREIAQTNAETGLKIPFHPRSPDLGPITPSVPPPITDLLARREADVREGRLVASDRPDPFLANTEVR